MKLRTIKPHIFGGKRRRVGDEYEAGVSDSRLMIALGYAEKAPEAEVFPAYAWPYYNTTSVEEAPVTKDKPKRKYVRRKKAEPQE